MRGKIAGFDGQRDVNGSWLAIVLSGSEPVVAYCGRSGFVHALVV